MSDNILDLIMPERKKKRGRYAKRGPTPQTAPTLARIEAREAEGYNMTRERTKLGVPLEDNALSG